MVGVCRVMVQCQYTDRDRHGVMGRIGYMAVFMMYIGHADRVDVGPSVRMCMFVYVYICMYVCVCMYVRVYIYMHVCVYCVCVHVTYLPFSTLVLTMPSARVFWVYNSSLQPLARALTRGDRVEGWACGGGCVCWIWV